MRPHAFLGLGFFGLVVHGSFTAAWQGIKEFAPSLSPGAKLYFSEWTPSLFFLLFIASFPLGYTVLRAFSLDSQEPVWKSRKTNIAFFLFHSGYSPNTAQGHMDNCVWVTETWEGERDLLNNFLRLRFVTFPSWSIPLYCFGGKSLLTFTSMAHLEYSSFVSFLPWLLPSLLMLSTPPFGKKPSCSPRERSPSLLNLRHELNINGDFLWPGLYCLRWEGCSPVSTWRA